MNPLADNLIGRRAFLRSGMGLGFLGLTALGDSSLLRATPTTHFSPRAKRVIFLYMSGGPSQFETFDPKPELTKRAGQPIPESLIKGTPVAQLQAFSQMNCLPPLFNFSQRGKSGITMSSIFPHLATVADELTVIHSMTTDAINHDPAHALMNTGALTAGRPSMGSWIYYGLGAETESLPGFVVLVSSGQYYPAQPISPRLWHSGFLPGAFQGVRLSTAGDPLPYLSRPRGNSEAQQRSVLNAVKEMQALNPHGGDLATRVNQYEMAFRLQKSAPELMNFSKEPASVLKSYGVSRANGSFGANCLAARRMAERGVRFIQIFHREWDHHNAIERGMKTTAAEVDQGCAALIKDLKARDMLKDTLVIWGGEFGRTPMAQADGRDHHMKAFSIFMAGGGVKTGFTYGKTDEFGYNVVENPVHVNDLHATMLHLLGLDHKRLTVRAQGRDMRLTDVGGEIVKGILA
jgi:uncharacterized protein (DUF1501 family)